MSVAGLLFASLLLGQPAQAEEPWAGLEPCLSPRVHEERGYIGYESYKARADVESPFTSGDLASILYFRLDNLLEIPLKLHFQEAISEDHFAWVPPGNPIVIETASDGDPAWSVPEGATFLHRMKLRDPQQSVLEIRMARRLPGARWAFGIYDAPEFTAGQCGAGDLVLRKTEVGPRNVEFMNENPAIGRMKLSYRPLSPQSCAGCHSMAPGLGLKRREIATCGFRPDALKGEHDMAADTADWSERYFKAYGVLPFILRAGTAEPASPDSVPPAWRAQGHKH